MRTRASSYLLMPLLKFMLAHSGIAPDGVGWPLAALALGSCVWATCSREYGRGRIHNRCGYEEDLAICVTTVPPASHCQPILPLQSDAAQCMIAIVHREGEITNERTNENSKRG